MLAAAATALALAPGAEAVAPTCPATYTPANPTCFPWQGDWTQAAVSVPSLAAPGTPFAGQVFLPTGPVTGPRPAVAVLHGLTGRMENLWYLARDLAGHGFVVVTVTNKGTAADTFTDAMRSMEAYLVGHATELSIDLSKVGLAGHSAGARATSLVQSQTDILTPAAVAALDNLQSSEQGDAGSAVYNPTCLGGTQTLITPRVPGLGIAMDAQSWTCGSSDPEVKKTAWTRWRAAGRPTIEVVDKGSNHFTFAQLNLSDSAALHVPAYLVRTWFQRWLQGDPGAVGRLFDPHAELGVGRDALLSTAFRSAAYLPDRGVDCASFTVAACQLP